MSTRTICDLCGKPIEINDVEHYKYKTKKDWWLWTSDGWRRIDVHRSCREKFFKAVNAPNPPYGNSSMQDD